LELDAALGDRRAPAFATSSTASAIAFWFGLC